MMSSSRRRARTEESATADDATVSSASAPQEAKKKGRGKKMSTINVKPQVPVAKTVKVPVPAGSEQSSDTKALEAESETRRGPFGGQQIPLKPIIGKGPRIRDRIVQTVNDCGDLLDWYVVLEPVPQPSAFVTNAHCRECHWASLCINEDKAKELIRDHAFRHHITAA